MRPGTGEVVAIYGGEDFIDDQINNATRQFAQAGSTFKPFALAAATEQDVPLNSVWNGDSPATVDGYTFANYGDRSYGPVTLLQATENSINSAYVELESDIGVGARRRRRRARRRPGGHPRHGPRRAEPDVRAGHRLALRARHGERVRDVRRPRHRGAAHRS